MMKPNFTIQFFALITFLMIVAGGAQGQSYRTWVSGTGDDNNSCSRSAPCRTFNGAIPKTKVNGEINCVDPGGYGAVTINKSLTIDCHNTLGSILASNVNGIIVNITTTSAADPLAKVRLRGLEINGAGSCGPSCGGRSGIRGIHINNNNTRQVRLIVEEVFIHGFVFDGLYFNGPGGDLTIKNSSIVDNGGWGVLTSSTLAGQTGVINVTIDGVRTDFNSVGVQLASNSFGVVKDSTASNNASDGYEVVGDNLGAAELTIRDSTANNNKVFGVAVLGLGSPATARIVNVTAINNSSSQLSVQPGGTICTNQKNHIGTPSDVPTPCFLDQ